MRKERILLLLGIWVAVLPYLGFPYSWKNIFFTAAGLGLIYVSFTLHKESKTKEKNKIPSPIHNFDIYKEASDIRTKDTVLHSEIEEITKS